MRITRTAVVTGVSLVCAAAVAVSGAAMATAHDNGASRSSSSSVERHGMKGAGLSDLVSQGTITQAQADAINTALDAQRTADMAAHDKAEAAALAGLVTKGTITQAQADAITKADRRGVRDLITKGTITQAQADAVRAAMQATHSESKTTREAKMTSVLTALVTKGTITQAQADAIKASAPAEGVRGMGRDGGRDGGHGDGHKGRGGKGMRGGTPSPTASPSTTAS